MKKLAASIVLFLMIFHVFGQDIKEGEKLFKSNCTACHSIGKGKIVGPDLKNVSERRKEKWLLKFIKTPGAVIKSGDLDARKLFEEHNQIVMPDHTFLTDDNIRNMLSFIDEQSKVEVVEVKKDLPKEETIKPKNDQLIKAEVQVSTMDYFLYILIGICIVLVIVSMFLIIQVMSYLKK